MKGIIILLVLILAAYLADLPIVSFPAALFIHVFLLGFLARGFFGKNPESFFESVLLSLIITTAVGLVLGNFLEVGGFESRAIFALGIGAVLVARRDKIELELNAVFAEVSGNKAFIILAAFSALPFFAIFIVNPTYSLISDGWWHCSIYNTIETGKLPPQNPWYAPEVLGYPYAYHVYMAYARGGGLDCLNGMNIFNYLATTIAMFGIYVLGSRTFKNEKAGIAAGLAFLFVSHLGGLGFIYDLIRLVPILGLGGYLDFLKSVHGPHTYYGHLEFIGLGGVVIPFQMSTMMASFHFALLAGLLYLLWRGEKTLAGACLAALFVTNPVVGIFGAVVTAVFVLLSEKLEVRTFMQWVVPGLIFLLISGNYIFALLDKQSVISSEVAVKGILDEKLLFGFLVGYLFLIAFTLVFFIKQKQSAEKKLWLSFLIGAVIAILLIRKGTTYVYTDLSVLFSIAAAPFVLRYFEEPRKNVLQIGLFLILVIPTFLVVGSYAYYKIPLVQEELGAAQWIRQNTPAESVFLVEMDFSQEFNLHQYVPVFGERGIFLGDPYLIKIYGDDPAEGLERYKKIVDSGDETEICSAKENGIDFIYLNSGKRIENSCIEKVYEKGKTIIYQVD